MVVKIDFHRRFFYSALLHNATPTVIIAVARPSNLESAGGILSSSLLPSLGILCPFSRPPVVFSQKLIRRRFGALETLGFLFPAETLRWIYKRIKCLSHRAVI